MTKDLDFYSHQFDYNIQSSPPAYSEQAIDSDWKHEIIEIKSLNQNSNEYGFVIRGGIDTVDNSPIVITDIDSYSNSLLDNGRTKLRLFDRILSINNTDLTEVTHDQAVQAFSLSQGQIIKLHIYRLNPLNIEYIDVKFPFDITDQKLGITITGGVDRNNQDPGLFITQIDSNGLLASITKHKQFHIGDRLLEIRTNYTSANLQWVKHSTGIELIRRICQDSRRVTFIVSHRKI